MNLRFQMCSIEYIVMALVERENSGTGFFFFSVLLSVWSREWSNDYEPCFTYVFTVFENFYVSRSQFNQCIWSTETLSGGDIHVWVIVIAMMIEVLGMVEVSCEQVKERPGVIFYLIKSIGWTCWGKWIVMVRDTGSEKRDCSIWEGKSFWGGKCCQKLKAKEW